MPFHGFALDIENCSRAQDNATLNNKSIVNVTVVYSMRVSFLKRVVLLSTWRYDLSQIAGKHLKGLAVFSQPIILHIHVDAGNYFDRSACFYGQLLPNVGRLTTLLPGEDRWWSSTYVSIFLDLLPQSMYFTLCDSQFLRYFHLRAATSQTIDNSVT